MEKKKYASNTRAKNKWNAENYDRLYPYVKKGKKEIYLAAAQAAAASPQAGQRLGIAYLEGEPDHFAAERCFTFVNP